MLTERFEIKIDKQMNVMLEKYAKQFNKSKALLIREAVQIVYGTKEKGG